MHVTTTILWFVIKMHFLIIFIILFACSNSVHAATLVFKDESRIQYTQVSGKKVACLKANPSISGSVRKQRKKFLFKPTQDIYSSLLRSLARRSSEKNKRRIQQINEFISSRNNLCNSIINPATPEPPAPPPVPPNEEIPPDVSFDLLPYRDNISEEDAKHFFRRAAFGGTQHQISAASVNGLNSTIQQLLNEIPTPELDAVSENLKDGDPDSTDDENYISADGVRYIQLLYAIKSPNQLKEKLAYFLQDLFAASYRPLNGGDGRFVVDYLNITRRNALGNFKTFAKQITVNGMMLSWLDGKTNRAGNVNENYAREFWELFTIGHDTYTEKDVNEAARAFTGWRVVWSNEIWGREVVFSPSRADTGQKVIFENTPYQQVGNFDYNQLIDITLDRHPKASEHLANALFKFFVRVDPTPEILSELSADLKNSGYQLAPVVSKIIRSNAFFSRQARRVSIKTPLEFVVGLLRTTDMPFDFRELDWMLTEMGQQVLNPPSVKGWDDDFYWINDQWVARRMNASSDFLNSARYRSESFTITPLVKSENPTSLALLNSWISLFDIKLSSEEYQKLYTYISTYQEWDGSSESWNYASAPIDQKEQKLRGLIFLLTNHDSYFMN